MLLFQMRKENLTSNDGESYHPRGFTWKCPSKQDNRNLELQSLVLRRKKSSASRSYLRVQLMMRSKSVGRKRETQETELRGDELQERTRATTTDKSEFGNGTPKEG